MKIATQLRKRIAFVALAMPSLGLFAFAASCSSSDAAATPDATTEAAADTADTSTSTDDASEAGSGGFSCELGDLSDVQPLTFTVVRGDPPTKPAGGTILPGRYGLTAHTFYQQSDAGLLDPDQKLQVLIEVNDKEEIRRTFVLQPGPDAGASPDCCKPSYNVAIYEEDGTTLKAKYLCSSIAAQVGKTSGGPFTATPGKIVTYTPALGYTIVDEFTAR
jgi:hypothetical protein